MRKLILTASIALVATVSLPIAAQTDTTMVGTAPGVAGTARTIKMTATITAIDPATRAVTLKGPRGNEITVTAGPEVKNFAQMKVGDRVNAEYVEALTLELKKGGGMPVARTEETGAATAKPGALPAGMVGQRVTIVADVVAVNAKTQTVTLRGPERTVELKVRDPEQFKLVKQGDQVEATYTEALALHVEPAKSKKAPN